MPATGGAVLGIDIGTSSTKGVLVSLDGRILGSRTLEHEVRRPAPGHVEMDGGAWWDEFRTIARELVAGAGLPVLAVGVSGMGPCVLLTDEDDVPLRPAILSGVDMRAQEQIEAIEAELGGDEIYRRTGTRLSSQAVGPKLRWVAEREPEVWSRARRFYMPASWLARRLTGSYLLDHHSASQCTPMYSIREQAWEREWAPPLAGPIALPELRWPGEAAGTVTAAAAAETGLTAGIPVITGTIDAWSEAVSVGGAEPGDLMLMYGTTMFLIATGSAPAPHPALWSTVGIAPGRYSAAGGMAASGAITAWLRELLGSPGYPDLIAEAEASPAGSNGLLMLPYLAGERSPFQDPDARGVIAGLSLNHTRGDLYRAVLEATGYGVRHIVDQIAAAGAPVRRVVAGGGGTQGTLWPQIVSDVTGLVQELPETTIGASYGAAFLAAGLVAEVAIADWNPPARRIEPDPERHARYDALYADYLALYPATAGIVHRLAGLQRDSARR